MKSFLLPLFAFALILPAFSSEAQDFGRYSTMPQTRIHYFVTRPTPPPNAKVSSAISARMITAARIAEKDAERRSIRLCWRYVKKALLKAGAVASYPDTHYAKLAGRELVENHGFVRLRVRKPADAPVGSVLVYGGPGAGHVEIRTIRGFASDYKSRMPCALPFLGAYAKEA